MAGEAREQFKPYIPDGDMAAYAKALPDRLREDFTAAMNLLRDKQFQALLVNYTRKKDSFLVAIGVEDTVTTEYLFRDGAGKEVKPEDYLAMFARFVRENPQKIEAIAILLDRPKEWGTQPLTELRNKLAETRERFTPEQLQKAHELHYHKALVDIISMVKHAARDQEPLWTAQERVAHAFDKLTAGKTFTEAQQAWLDRIRAHLIKNLSIDRDDFDEMPVFTRHGGWTKADQDFEGKLEQFLREVNEAIAA
jgi:type I restriction enzyme R subunit